MGGWGGVLGTHPVSHFAGAAVGRGSSAWLFSSFAPSQGVQFDVRPGVCISGASPESVARLLGELAQYGTHYLRLSHFSLQSADKKGLVFQVRIASASLPVALRWRAPTCTPSVFCIINRIAAFGLFSAPYFNSVLTTPYLCLL